MMVWLLWLYLLLLFNSLIYSLTSSSSLLSSPSPLCHHDESSALLLFNNSFTVYDDLCRECTLYGLSNNPCQTLSWENGTDCCTWSGVTCDKKTGHVIGLDLNCGGLVGIIQSNSSLFLLRHLRSLILSRNEFRSSQISSQFGRFASMTHLDLSYSDFSGKVPPEISHLSKLVSLNLSNNHCSLTLETSWVKRFIQNVTNIKELALRDVNMSSILPTSLVNLSSSLTSLDIKYTRLHGEFPESIFRLPNLQQNRFHGMIPAIFVKGNNLRNLDLNGNQLEGSLPRSLLACKKLEVLDLGNNKINDTFPHWLESLPMLQILVLKSNKFHGSIAAYPKVRFPFRKLRIMDLSHNEFNGPLPTKYFEKLMAMVRANTSLEYMGDTYYHDSVTVVMKGIDIELVRILNIFTSIDFSQNNFEGEIPKSIGKLKSLKGLNFSHNKLTSLIPPSLGDLSELEWLDLSSNMLSGEIPQQLANLMQLEKLNLSLNKLAGPIPHGNQFNTFSNDSYSGNFELCGFPLSKSCSKQNLTQEEGEDHEEELKDGLFDWKMVMMGYGCGVVIGVSVGYMVLFSKRFDYWIRKRIRGRQGQHCKTNARLRGRRRN